MHQNIELLSQTDFSLQDAMSFMRAFIACIDQTGGDQTQVFQFLQANHTRLSYSLLDELPRVFELLLPKPTPKPRRGVGLFGSKPAAQDQQTIAWYFF